MLNAISLVIEQRKNEFDKVIKNPVFSHLFLCLARVISFSGHLPRSIFSREVDITSTQNLLIGFKRIICKLNYSHVIIKIITKLYIRCNDDTISFCYIYKSLITILAVMMMKRRWTVMMIWNILRMLWTI